MTNFDHPSVLCKNHDNVLHRVLCEPRDIKSPTPDSQMSPHIHEHSALPGSSMPHEYQARPSSAVSSALSQSEHQNAASSYDKAPCIPNTQQSRSAPSSVTPNCAAKPQQSTSPASHPHSANKPLSTQSSATNKFGAIKPQYIQSTAPQTFNTTNPPLPPSMFAFQESNTAPRTSDEYLDQMVKIYDVVRDTKLPNYQSARIPLPRKLNVTAWRMLAEGYHDSIIFDYLEYGHPLGYVHGLAQLPTYESPNHPSALRHPDIIQKHLDTEILHGAMLGPFTIPPYSPWCHVSPMMTADKRDWSLDEDAEPEKRVVTDLSWPHGLSVNDGCPKDVYDSYLYKLQLPCADNLIEMILKAGPNSWMWSSDISRAFRQLPLDPLDWPLLCVKHDGNYYSDVSLAFGARWASACCQRMSDSLTFIMDKQNYSSKCYVDDTAGCEKEKKTCENAFDYFNQTCDQINLERALHKGVRSTQLLRWIGWLFDTVKMQVRLPDDKKQAILNLCIRWLKKSHASLRELRQLLGKLLHISQVVKPARLFLTRMLDTLRAFPQTGKIELSGEFLKDVRWFVCFLDAYNGINLILPVPTIPHVISVDSCSTGCGGVFRDQCYHYEYPAEITAAGLSACHLEMLNCLISLRLWSKDLRGETITLNSDSQIAVNVLQHGRSRDPFMLQCARNVWMLLSLYQITLISEHVSGESLILSADALSRYHLGGEFKERADYLIVSNNLTVVPISPDMLSLDYSI